MDTRARRHGNAPGGRDPPGSAPGAGYPRLFRRLSGLLLLLPGLPLDLLLLAEHRALLGDLDVVDGYVDLGHPQAGQVLHPIYDVAARRLGELRDRVAVLDGHREVHGRLLLAHLDADATGVVRGRALAGHGAGYALQEAADRRGRAAAHLHLLDLLGRDAGDLGDHRVANGRPAALALEGVPPALSGALAQGLSSPRRLWAHSCAKPGTLKP